CIKSFIAYIRDRIPSDNNFSGDFSGVGASARTGVKKRNNERQIIALIRNMLDSGPLIHHIRRRGEK
ncbi:MAG: hypothetical protein VX107_01675, partial [Pseudomonadota bacterium]|nr:hypothetical protein [Pseudomonadota bacterium]